MAGKREFGSVDQLPSGRWRARYTGPDRQTYTARTAGGSRTFETKKDATAALRAVHHAIDSGTWVSPKATKPAPAAVPTFEEYARAWITTRTNRRGQALAVRTQELYLQLLERRLVPTFGALLLTEITPELVDVWYAEQGGQTPTARAHAYGLLKSILQTATVRRSIPFNPCMVEGGGVVDTARKIRPASLDELAVLVAELPERYRMLAQLACWCSLRFGELTELRRGDVDLKAAVIRVRRAVVTTKAAGQVVKAPKSSAGVRDVTIPPHLVEDLRAHLRQHAQPGSDGLVFPAAGGGHLTASSLHKVYRRARAAAGRPDLTFHDLRHTGQTYAAATGANLRELMARAGQSSPGAALRYLHEVDGRQREIAERLAELATSTKVTPIAAKRSAGGSKRKAT